MTIGYDVRDRIAYVSFERREKHNAFRTQCRAAAPGCR
jgi:1,4-dihydroxy-2-naphthoyl-CoA synthase